jgi:spermidine/putrescine transport system ATP-binding protein
MAKIVLTKRKCPTVKKDNTVIITIENVSKSYQGQTILDGLDLEVYAGEFLTLLGASGCGKTTLLRMLSGFDQPDSGKIYLNGQDLSTLPANQRNINTVFQNYALFPHMTVFENVAFGLRCKGVQDDIIKKKVGDMLKVVRLEHLSNRKPQQISGGQQQRVAIARAAINEPLVLLLDEPLSSLDYSLRKNMQIELKQLQRQFDLTFIFVTHDQEEALSMSDRVAVMHEGHIEQIGTPREVYEKPINLQVARFIGGANLFDTEILSLEDKVVTVRIENKVMTLKNNAVNHINQKIITLVRPEDLKIWHENEIEDPSKSFAATVEQVIYKGSTVDLILRLESGKKVSATEFFDDDDDKLDFYRGEKVWAHWYPGWEVILVDKS